MFGVSEDDDPLVKYMEDPLGRYHRADGSPSVSPRNWSGRIRFEYADAFDEISRVGGHMLLSTSARFGLDMQMSSYQEDLLGTARNELWLGDFNVIYRFAQSERAQFRTGLGLNWLDDPIDTDIGFNFTYGADVFPRKPWILSATIDWGTIGSAELYSTRSQSAGTCTMGLRARRGLLSQSDGLGGPSYGSVHIWLKCYQNLNL